MHGLTLNKCNVESCLTTQLADCTQTITYGCDLSNSHIARTSKSLSVFLTVSLVIR